jgi:hypothetical protein
LLEPLLLLLLMMMMMVVVVMKYTYYVMNGLKSKTVNPLDTLTSPRQC